MVKGVHSPQVQTDLRGGGALPLAHDLANHTKGRFIASVMSDKRFPRLTPSQTRDLPHLLNSFLATRTARVYQAELEPPISCLVSPAQISPAGPDGSPPIVSVSFTYLFYLGDPLRGCKVTSNAPLPISPDTIRGICELDKVKANQVLNKDTTLKLYGEAIIMESVDINTALGSDYFSSQISAKWVSDQLGLTDQDADALSAIIAEQLESAPRVDAIDQFIGTLDPMVTEEIRTQTAPSEDSTKLPISEILSKYNDTLREIETRDGALASPPDVEDAIAQLTPFSISEEGAGALSCHAVLSLLRERERLEDRVFQVSNEKADPRLIEILERIDPEIALLKSEIQRRRITPDAWNPDDNVNYITQAVDFPITYKPGSEAFNQLIFLSLQRLKNLTKEELESLLNLPPEILQRIRDILKFLSLRFASETELLRTISDALRTGLSEDKKIRFGGTQEDHHFAFLLVGPPMMKVEFQIGEDLDIHGSPRAFIYNLGIEPFTPPGAPARTDNTVPSA